MNNLVNEEQAASQSCDSPLRLPGLIIAAAATLTLLLIVTTKGVKLPVHSPNDRSRWSTIYCLTEKGTYSIDESRWKTIDKVMIDGSLYSTKPPLLPTFLAYEYEFIRWLSGGRLSFTENTSVCMRILIASINWIPFVFYLLLLHRLLNSYSLPSSVHAASLLAAGFCTFLSGFAVTLNNHNIAAYCCFFSIYCAIQIVRGSDSKWHFVWLGLFTALMTANELPALSLATFLGCIALWKNPRSTVFLLLPCAMIIAASHFYLNWKAVGTIKPAYMQKDAYEFEGSYWKRDPDSGRLVTTDPESIDSIYEPWHVYLLNLVVGHHGLFSLTPVLAFCLVGVFRELIRRDSELWIFGSLLILLTLILLTFYVAAPALGVGQRNYGGMCVGPRWLFWTMPFWIIFLPSGLMWRPHSGWYRYLFGVCLAVSAYSTYYAVRGPWSRPWIHQILYDCGWTSY